MVGEDREKGMRLGILETGASVSLISIMKDLVSKHLST
jgi:hypothetical protein